MALNSGLFSGKNHIGGNQKFQKNMSWLCEKTRARIYYGFTLSIIHIHLQLIINVFFQKQYKSDVTKINRSKSKPKLLC